MCIVCFAIEAEPHHRHCHRGRLRLAMAVPSKVQRMFRVRVTVRTSPTPFSSAAHRFFWRPSMGNHTACFAAAGKKPTARARSAGASLEEDVTPPRRECMCDVVGRRCAFGVSLWGERKCLPCTRQFRETCQDAGGARGGGRYIIHMHMHISCAVLRKIPKRAKGA